MATNKLYSNLNLGDCEEVVSQSWWRMVKVNDDLGHYFQSKKGLQYGNPLSPVIFNFSADMPTIFVQRARVENLVELCHT